MMRNKESTAHAEPANAETAESAPVKAPFQTAVKELDQLLVEDPAGPVHATAWGALETADPRRDGFQIFVCDKATRTLTGSSTTPIEAVVSDEDAWLTWGGKVLEHGRTLGDYGIHNGATLVLSFRGRGGTAQEPGRPPQAVSQDASSKSTLEDLSDRVKDMLSGERRAVSGEGTVQDVLSGEGTEPPASTPAETMHAKENLVEAAKPAVRVHPEEAHLQIGGDAANAGTESTGSLAPPDHSDPGSSKNDSVELVVQWERMDGAQAISKRIRCPRLEDALRKTLKAAQKKHTKPGKPGRIEFGRAEYLPFATHEVKQGDVIEVDGVAWKASKAIIVADDAVILTRGESRMLTGAATAIGCGGVALGAFLVLLVQGLAASSTGPCTAPTPPPTAPPALALTIPSSGPNCITREGWSGASPLVQAAFVPTFFNLSCIAAGGTGDPCHTLMAEDYTNLRFSALRFDHLIAQYLSFCILFSLALLGGIPRATDWNGLLFWLAWMITQAAQLVVTVVAILFELAAFLGVRAQLWSCLVAVDGLPLLDFYAMTTFACQPAIVIKLAMTFAYAYLLNLGLLVFDGSRKWPWHSRRVLPASPLRWKSVGNTMPKRTELLKNDILSRKLAASEGNLVEFTWEECLNMELADVRTHHVVYVQDKGYFRPFKEDDKNGASQHRLRRRSSVVPQVAEEPGAEEDVETALQRKTPVEEASDASTPTPSAMWKHSKAVTQFVCCGSISAVPKAIFVADATGAKKPRDKDFRAALSVSTPLFHAARWLLLSVAFSAWPALGATDGLLPGIASSWAMSAVVAFALPWIVEWAHGVLQKKLKTAPKNSDDAWVFSSVPVILMFLITSPPLLSTGCLLPLAALVIAVVGASYASGSFVLEHVEEDDDGQSKWVTSAEKRGSATQPLWLWANRLAGPSKTSLGWLGAFASFSPFDAFVGRPPSEFMAYTNTSFATLAGGLACFWAVLAMAPCISFGAWAQARALLTKDAGNGAGNVTTTPPLDLDSDAFRGWTSVWESMMIWVWLGLVVSLLLLAFGLCECSRNEESRLQRVLPEKWRREYDAERSEMKCLRIVCLYSPPFLFFFIFLAAQSTEGKQLVAVAYAASFESFATLQVNWDGLLPSFDRMFALLSDPAAVLTDLLQRLANVNLRLDPDYFAEGVRMLYALNLCLSVLKLIATYGRKFFALVDTAKAFLRVGVGYAPASDNGDGTAQVSETITDNAGVRGVEFLTKVGWDKPFGAFQHITEWDLASKGISDVNIPGLLWLLQQTELQGIKHLVLKENTIGAKGAEAIRKWLAKNTTLARLEYAAAHPFPSVNAPDAFA